MPTCCQALVALTTTPLLLSLFASLPPRCPVSLSLTPPLWFWEAGFHATMDTIQFLHENSILTPPAHMQDTSRFCKNDALSLSNGATPYCVYGKSATSQNIHTTVETTPKDGPRNEHKPVDMITDSGQQTDDLAPQETFRDNPTNVEVKPPEPGSVETSPPKTASPASPQAQAFCAILNFLVELLLVLASNYAGLRSLQSDMDPMHPLSEGVNVQSVTFPSLEDVWTVEGDLFLPEGLSLDEAKVAVVHMHGGAHCTGSRQQDGGLSSEMSAQTGVPVLNVDMRLLPEHTPTQQLGDVLGAVDFLQTDFGLSSKQIALSGCSAGSNLAILAALNLTKQGKPARALLLQSPVDTVGLFTESQYLSMRENKHIDFLSPRLVKVYATASTSKATSELSFMHHVKELSPETSVRLVAGVHERYRDHSVKAFEILKGHREQNLRPNQCSTSVKPPKQDTSPSAMSPVSSLMHSQHDRLHVQPKDFQVSAPPKIVAQMLQPHHGTMCHPPTLLVHSDAQLVNLSFTDIHATNFGKCHTPTVERNALAQEIKQISPQSRLRRSMLDHPPVFSQPISSQVFNLSVVTQASNERSSSYSNHQSAQKWGPQARPGCEKQHVSTSKSLVLDICDHLWHCPFIGYTVVPESRDALHRAMQWLQHEMSVSEIWGEP